MQKSVRQSMAWLHSWLGLSLGWLLFAIFLTGATTYYRHEINLWMQPQFATMQVKQDTAMNSAYQYLQQNAADAQNWYIGLASPSSPVNKIYWQKSNGGYESKTLDANTGKEITLSATQGGEFFYSFHYQLYGVPYFIGRLVVTIAAFLMMIILISGIITHKKIFTEFFTLRAFKGQRSYLDFHNVTSVIALPFFLTITFTGLAIFFYLILPNGMKKLYPEQPFQYFDEIRNISISSEAKPIPATMRPMDYFIQQSELRWGKTEIDNITIKHPNTHIAQVNLVESTDRSITRSQAQLSFNGVSGALLGDTRNHSAIATLNNGVYGLHIAHFAQPLLRFTLFFSGLLGCAMIASGLLLWSLKRQLQNKKQSFHFGHYVVNRLNTAAIIGLPIAMLSYLFTNRVLQLEVGQPNYEIYAFFGTWLLSLIIALLTPQQHLWKAQLKVFILLAVFLPIFNLYYLISHQYVHDLHEYWLFLRVDLMIMILAILAIFLHQKVQPIQQKAVQKIQKKYANTAVQEPNS